MPHSREEQNRISSMGRRTVRAKLLPTTNGFQIPTSIHFPTDKGSQDPFNDPPRETHNERPSLENDRMLNRGEH